MSRHSVQISSSFGDHVSRLKNAPKKTHRKKHTKPIHIELSKYTSSLKKSPKTYVSFLEHVDLRVQNEQFSEEKGFILRYTEWEVQLPPGFEPPIHGLQSERSTTELPDFLMNGHKNSVYQVQNKLFTNHSGIRNCHKMTNCEQFRTKCCVKISATLTLASTHVFLIKMCQECYNRSES